jgi:hypothetical protein
MSNNGVNSVIYVFSMVSLNASHFGLSEAYPIRVQI